MSSPYTILLLCVLIIIILCSLEPSSAAESLNNSLVNDTKFPKSRIVGGINAQRNEFPFIVSYQEITGKHLCGGSILNKDWILTAAHCMVLPPRETQVLAGLLNLGETHPDIQIAAVSEQIIHPYYPGGVQPAANDIALLHLAWSLRWTIAVQPIYLPPQNVENRGYAWTAGWGYVSSSHPIPSTRLQQAEMFILTIQQCAYDLIDIAGETGPLDQNMICGRGSYTGSETICKGDSGGPLVQQGRIIGVTSWTLEPCGINRAPSVFTQVRKYLDFIRYYVPGV